ncbi:N-acetylglucosaminyl-phosphatidylinositol de-N-acetylase-like isoform X1 [Zingiber officinale]|uniref:N-acetylglucosaminyl-phosphatidylinositol de-N-acetylase-like isoform X1 n=1 Tax=Zingiber officinale TaxID=94328 RepID=UPI001C4C65AD|nr:N-acetylglucosaminyl-phosphatidylinositol de-N-acetylase-like isoform X1 [Zingiber officinale]XP_042464915.1 N-acetylglucosaminyl-phosphatidylinositol de-N-acetylase-like isoform X1 [Zingiber officinale]XP_042464917.1 N-acetylglucosaminyl-phosphatidylinositol de-N-acetylase-like isoform X1 [Zingiber officinale]XP_042464918.1 N-acetylglucosaminyl-phosphatidylinositol de-N-acetylase-like isoform X1 [Zingiber officinale]XP_042464919.1 N-acetylglucosaminyl-phosphatidylinositol de-N-acetylase-lik
MSWLLAAVAAVILFWVISLARILSSSSCVPSDPGFLHSGFGKRRNVLLVIAHPDDESMFFTPTILFLKYGGHNIHILCMSTGNADGVGNTRKDEIYQACSILKVPLQQVKVLDHPGLQDGFNETWDLGFLAKLIQNEVRVWNIDLLISFDKFGVSGHPNHRAVHHGICMLLSDSNQKHIEAWELVSLSIFRKYSGPVDVWLSIIFSSFYLRKQIYCLLNNNPSLSFLAMAAHRSQWIWFRKLFVGFSTYTYMNTLRKINVE